MARIKGDIKSYLILSIIIIITLLIVFYSLNWYKQYNDLKLSVPVISSTVKEVSYEELNTIVKERELLIVYMCTSSESKCRNFESKFKAYIKEENLSEEIVYLNIGLDKDNGFLNKIYNDYKSNDLIKKINNYPTLLIFNNGKIIDLLSPSNDIDVSINSVKQFLSGYDL